MKIGIKEGMKDYIFLIAIVLAGALSACSTGQSPSETGPPVAVSGKPPAAGEAASLPPAAEEAAEEKEQEEIFINYNPRGRRDPFRSIVLTRTGVNLQRNVENLPPLQRKDLSDLKVIGIIWGEMGPNAIVTVPGGKGYTVRVGTRIGLNNGVIKRITQNEIVVEETLLNIFGETSRSDVIMELHPHKEGLE